MKHLNAESIYSQIILLSDSERDRLYNRMTSDFYPSKNIIAYTTNGDALTHEQYIMQVNAGIKQCLAGESISLEDLSKELGYHYADL